MEEVDEAEIFQGGEKRLTMYQTYTHEFQCVYKLTRYPFDTQVREAIKKLKCSFFLNTSDIKLRTFLIFFL